MIALTPGVIDTVINPTRSEERSTIDGRSGGGDDGGGWHAQRSSWRSGSDFPQGLSQHNIECLDEHREDKFNRDVRRTLGSTQAKQPEVLNMSRIIGPNFVP